MYYQPILFVFIALFSFAYSLHHSDKYYKEKFEEFQTAYNKHYNSIEEKKYDYLCLYSK